MMPLRILAVGELAAEAVEDIIAEHQCDAIVSNKILANQEGLREPLRPRLDRIIDHESELGAVTKEALEGPCILRGGDDEDFPNTRLDERGQRIVNHRLVIDGHELLRDALGNRVEPRAGTAG